MSATLTGSRAHIGQHVAPRVHVPRRSVVVKALPEILPTLADANMSLAVTASGAVVALGALLVSTDPQRRRAAQMTETGGDEKEAVRKYFNTAGFERWNKIYGETEEVNKVQLDIRKGHAQTVDKVLAWFDAAGGVQGVTVCDAGCGTGSLTIPLAMRGAKVFASDISESMCQEAARRFDTTLSTSSSSSSSSSSITKPVFEATDLESVKGQYQTVCCLDVMIHYPQDRVDAMISHLASLSSDRLVISFAPDTPALTLLKRIGELFPGSAKATRAYLHKEANVEAALERAGFKVTQREFTGTQFYFSTLFEAKRV